MPPTCPVRIELTDFASHQSAIMAVRKAVFIDELGIPSTLEWDKQDAQAIYAIASTDQNIIAIGRLLPDGRLGRLATLLAWRKQGIASKILDCLINAARHAGHKQVHLSAQLSTLDFYKSRGFIPTGQAFIAAGIQHQAMHRVLPVRHELL